MDKEEVQKIVIQTINELKRQGMLKDKYSVVLKEVEPVLREYFKKHNNKKVEFFLYEHSDDPYIDIIYLQYRDCKTLEWIAERLGREISTVKRNKKRLMISMYDMLMDL